MVDKADSRCHIAVAPQKQGGAGGSDSEIEITPQMVRAGAARLSELDGASSIYAAEEIYRAMSEASRGYRNPQ